MENSRKMKVSGMQCKSITFDRKKFVTALAKAVLNGIPAGCSMIAGHPSPSALTKLGENIVDLVASFGLKTSPEGLASKLIFTAASEAAFALVREAVREESKEDAQPTIAALYALLTQSDPEDLAAILERRLTTEPLEIDRHFFTDPAKPLPIDAIADVLAHWLDKLGLTRPQTQTIANRFERYFVYAVYDEWKSTSNGYAELLTALETPFDAALEKAMAWERYGAHLRRQVQLPMMAEPFGLDAVYIPLRAYTITKNCPENECGEAREVFRRAMDSRMTIVTQHIVELHQAVHDWLDKKDKDDAIRLVCGGPGSGKSSFAKMLAVELVGAEERLVFVPLSQKDPSKNIKNVIEEFLQSSGLLPFNPMDDRDKPLLLILDGLDELSLQGRSGEDAARQLLEEVRRAVSIANYDKLCLRCLITGRYLAVQAVEYDFHLAQTSLHILPYWIDKEKETPNPDDPKRLLDTDQRDGWWRKYGLAKGMNFNGMPEPLQDDRLREMSGQPLLNYLLAIIYVREPEKLVEASRPAIYNKLLSDVYERDYKKPHLPLGNLRHDEFLFVLEKIAVAIWHGDGRTANLGELKAHCEGSQAKQLLEKVLAGVDQGLMRLLTAFYFRQAMRRGESETFEFTHKSFGEYLAARHIVATLVELSEEALRSATAMRSTWSPVVALQEWIALCGPQPMDEYLYRFVEELIAEEPAERVERWQQFCVQLIDLVLDQGMPMGPRPEALSFKGQCQLARNAECALLAMHHACALRTKSVSKLKWGSPTGLRELLSWLEPNAKISLARKSLGYQDLKGQQLSLMNFMGADLMGAKLEGAKLIRAYLQGANLGGANLIRAKLEGADLEGANLLWANLFEANLLWAKLGGAKLGNGDSLTNQFKNKLLSKAIFDDPALREALDADVDLSQLRSYTVGRPSEEQAAALATLIKKAKMPSPDFTGAPGESRTPPKK